MIIISAAGCCPLHNFYNATDWRVGFTAFGAGALSVIFDKRNHALQFGYFFAPKALSFLTMALMIRGLLTDHPLIWKLVQAFSMGILAVYIFEQKKKQAEGSLKNSQKGQNKDLNSIVLNSLQWMWTIDEKREKFAFSQKASTEQKKESE
uniref:Uncharacterized protein n=1 Tax=Strombidium rassoulzadegani TaxID=1082188 RepID=A0A7S3FUL1_9SPIT|mmetsp:Transcript_16387/g.27752  ORF Transcript_16387/g.27752 Transcript_16387/m.27752 type:complete len:150 (+) Transcript_16387:383-832(+)